MAEEEMSDAELADRLANVIGTAPMAEEKQNVHTFLHNVATAEDTTKTGFLRDDKDLDEVGIPKLPTRSYKTMALIADKIMGNDFFRDFFEKEAEIITSTSLSREAKLLQLAVIQKREIADVTKKPMKENKGWFKKKQPVVYPQMPSAY